MRTTAEKVKQIIETTLEDVVVEAYIESANLFITDILGETLSVTTLSNIEMWLTAHLLAITRERMAKKEEAGGAGIEYIGEFGSNLHSTPYGQMAMLLDSTNTLSLMSSNAKKSIVFKAIKSFS